MMKQRSDSIQLPRGWAQTKMGEICDLINGRAFKRSEWSSKGLPIVRIQNLNDPNAEFNYCDFMVHEKYLVNNGQLLFAWSGTPETSFGAHLWDRGRGVLNQHIFKVQIDERHIDKSFLMYLINHKVNEFITKAHGTAGLAHITKSRFEDSSVFLPPLSEQHRIAAKTEELSTEVDAGTESLRKVKAQLQRYRQAVLKYAFEGKLTEEWRKTHKHETEPASMLLERIKEERKKKEKGKYRELPPVDTSNLSELPESWIQTRLGDGCDSVEKVNPKDEPDSEFEYLEISSIDNRRNKVTKSRTIMGKHAPSRARQRVKEGDILFSTVRTYLKNIAMVDEIYDGQIASTGFCVIRPSKPISKKLVFYLTLTDSFVNPLTQLQRGTSYPAVVYSDVFAQIIPLPPVSEQYRIVEELETHFSVIDEAEKVAEQSLMQSERLRQSILKRAFEGRLVPQDPTDEPAENLLERIREKKEQKFEGIRKKRIKREDRRKQVELVRYVK